MLHQWVVKSSTQPTWRRTNLATPEDFSARANTRQLSWPTPANSWRRPQAPSRRRRQSNAQTPTQASATRTLSTSSDRPSCNSITKQATMTPTDPSNPAASTTSNMSRTATSRTKSPSTRTLTAEARSVNSRGASNERRTQSVELCLAGRRPSTISRVSTSKLRFRRDRTRPQQAWKRWCQPPRSAVRGSAAARLWRKDCTPTRNATKRVLRGPKIVRIVAAIIWLWTSWSSLHRQ